ncbi:MAG TPA: 1-deoxy-D-xylulose-5-phosphate reductoisomerase [Burkholderiales bacterium]|nr:1-deoxy-D-xylulose-5-phosphate reductoisomerase [Burkholderiales bacterium]
MSSMRRHAPPRRLAILGATGSVGVSTLDVVARHPGRFEVVALTAHAQVERLLAQCRRFIPRYAVLGEAREARSLEQQLRADGLATRVLAGPEALVQVATLPDVDTVMAAIVGAAGLPATLAAAQAGKRVLLANKEALVMAGQLFREALRSGGAQLLPIDSEHNAVLQSLPADFDGDLESAGVRRILLTASGGPFLRAPPESLTLVTPEQACAHPNWVMGRKISVDSATMMNKGLEVIEACFLFSARPAQIEVVVHPQSVVHSMVEYVDGSVLAQLGNPDMRTPIAHALGFPERIESGVRPLNFFEIGTLNFEAPDLARFPCLRLAYAALAAGESGAVTLNAANEVAVDRFLRRELTFDLIPSVIEEVLSRAPVSALHDLAHVLEVDREARALARQCLSGAGAARVRQLHG